MSTELAHWLSTTTVERGWTLRLVAKRAGISHATVARVANAEVHPSVETCNALAYVFDVPVDMIYDMEGVPETKRGNARTPARDRPVRDSRRIVYEIDGDQVLLAQYHALRATDQALVRDLIERLGQLDPRIIGNGAEE